jgi:hypothetical protein
MKHVVTYVAVTDIRELSDIIQIMEKEDITYFLIYFPFKIIEFFKLKFHVRSCVRYSLFLTVY